jgi:hypothetical protein
MSEDGGGDGAVGMKDGGDYGVSVWAVRWCWWGDPGGDEGLVRVVYFTGGGEPSAYPMSDGQEDRCEDLPMSCRCSVYDSTEDSDQDQCGPPECIHLASGESERRCDW